jgi:hypothetical protein
MSASDFLNICQNLENPPFLLGIISYTLTGYRPKCSVS